ncbi:elongation factor P maturation arginine rhamnosyltransferase EarP [Pigmentiphaga soli]|uniref:elongation factor P maturation arginine rhamnosyltransferase EarP n=1 Tax=Pigmentiphaga soli TaxID=1007095 RepID=UPI0031EEDD78
MHADLFCRIIDNYGDIGVCWRLARQMAAEHGWAMRLWVDDLAVFARLEPRLDPGAARQAVGGIEVVHWTQPAPDLAPADVVIEAFACDPPPAYVHRMQDSLRRPAWINLEYLSAEPWIDNCHALPSPQPSGLVKYFFFPGFTEGSGGLIRERGLTAARDALQAGPAARAAWLRETGIEPRDDRLVTLFCYPDASASVLADVLAQDERPSTLAVAHGVAPYLRAGERGALRIARLPFLSQPGYDRLLWCADLNFVRGEDSFVRAQWAARPMVWHIYPQAQAAHIDKLHAWLAREPAPLAGRELNAAWNGETGRDGLAQRLRAALAPAAWQDWRRHARAWSDRLAAQDDLAARLAAFCRTLRESRP